jgi:hypothetical protein
VRSGQLPPVLARLAWRSGSASAITARWCVYRLIWLFYPAVTVSRVGWTPVSLVFPPVLWGVIGVVAAVTAIGFLTRDAKGT